MTAPAPAATDWIRIGPAAAHLDVSAKYLRANATRYGGRKVAGSWRFTREDLDRAVRDGVNERNRPVPVTGLLPSSARRLLSP